MFQGAVRIPKAVSSSGTRDGAPPPGTTMTLPTGEIG